MEELELMESVSSLKVPTHLRVNLLEFAYNCDRNMTFSWWDNSQQNSANQVAFQIVLAERLHQLADKRYDFDSNWVESSQNTAVRVTGLEKILQPGKLYYWQVRVKDNYGNISDFSEPEKFLTAEKVAPKQGIWAADTTQPGDMPHLRNVVFLRSPLLDLSTMNVDSAIVTAFSRGNESVLAQGFDLYLNGESVGVGSARPLTNYQGTDDTAIFYNRYDVTAQLKQGSNVLAVLATGARIKSLQSVNEGHSILTTKIDGTDEHRAFWCKLDLFTTDGQQKTVLVSDDTWKALDGSSAFGDFGAKIRSLYFEMVPENMDMRYYPKGWTDIQFDDSKWENASLSHRVLVDEHEKLVPYRSENSQRFETNFLDKNIKIISDHDFIVDLGKEIIGSLSVNINSKYEQRIDVFYGEQLDADGHVRHHLASGPDYVESWTLTKGKNKFTTLQMKNFRYVEFVGFHGSFDQESVKGWAIRQNFDEDEGDFHSDNSLLNREFELSKYTIEATNQDVFVDSQARERRPYEGDLLVNGLTSFAVSSQYSLNRHSIDYLIDNPTWPEDYKLFLVEMAWQDYLYTGDKTLLASRYDDLKVKFNRGVGEDSFDGASSDFMGNLKNGQGIDNFDEQVGLVTNNGLVDWPIPERDGFVEGKYNTPFNAVFYGTYLIMSKISKLTGHEEDAQHFYSRASRIKEEMLSRLYDDKTGRFYDSLNADLTVNKHFSHHSSAYALCYGVYDNEQMGRKIADFVGNDGDFVGSVYFIYFMLKGLTDSGNADKAIDLLANDDSTPDKKTFAAILDSLGATIAPEAWSNKYKANLTLSHPWGATPGLILVQGIFGIIPLDPGFDKFQLKIRPGTLSEIGVRTPSAKGIIHAVYQKIQQQHSIKITVPMNSTVHVDLPNKAADVTVDGKQLDKYRSGIFDLSSGSYEIKYL